MLSIAVIALVTPDSNSNSAANTTNDTSSPTSTASTSPRPSASPTASSSSSSSRPGPSLSLGDSSSGSGNAAKLPLIVLNNTRTNGLATDAADAFRNGGWKVERIGNLSNNILSTCAYYDPSVDGAKSAAKALRKQFPGIKRTASKFSGLPAGPIVVVLTSGFSST